MAGTESTSDISHTEALGENDAGEVYFSVSTLTSHYFTLGLALHLPPHKLKEIDKNNPNDAATALQMFVFEWLKCNYDKKKYGKPTWRMLAEVVDHPAGGDNHQLAKEIATKYLPGGKIPLPSSSTVNETDELRENDTYEVYKKVHNLASLYYELGQALCLDESKLDEIRHNYQKDARRALIEVIVEWLKGNYDLEKHGRPSWKMLEEARRAVTERPKILTKYSVPLILLAVVVVLAISLLLYGQAGVHKQDVPILSKTLPLPVENFVGRENETSKLLSWLSFHSPNSTKVVNIYGPPGFGKSALAKEVGNRLAEGEQTLVHYVDMEEFSGVQVKQVIAERVFKSVYNTSQMNVTFEELLDWSKETELHNLLILDGCDNVLNRRDLKDDLIDGIESLLLYSKNVKVLITSREMVLFVSAFKLYKVNNLSSDAAHKLLEYKAPSKLNLTEKNIITELTGNVPLALHVVGALLSIPDGPAPGEVIAKLEENRIKLTSAESMRTREQLNASIGLSYSYLDAMVQKHGRYLAQFPGSFDLAAAMYILKNISNDPNATTEHFEDSVWRLCTMSLLELDIHSGRYHFHQLIREFFLEVQVAVGRGEGRITAEFRLTFQLHYSYKLYNMTDQFVARTSESLETLETERHNIQYLLALTRNPLNITSLSYLFAIVAFEYSLAEKFLRCRFSEEELLNTQLAIIFTLEGGGLNGQTQLTEDNFSTYVGGLIMLSGRTDSVNGSLAAFEVLHNRIDIVELVANEYPHHVNVSNAYILYYRALLILSENFLNENTTRLYSTRLLGKLNRDEGNYSGPANSPYDDIGRIYYQMQDYEMSIKFLTKALDDDNLELMPQVELTALLIFSYANVKNFENYKKSAEKLLRMYRKLKQVSPSLICRHYHLISLVIGMYRTLHFEDFAAILEQKQLESVLTYITEISGESDKVTLEQEWEMKSVLGFGQKNSTSAIDLAADLANQFYSQHMFSKAIEFATVTLVALEHMEEQDVDVSMKLQLQLIIGKAKCHNQSTTSEGMKILSEVADFIIEQNATIVHVSEFTEVCQFLGWYSMNYWYNCYVRNGSTIYLATWRIFTMVFDTPLETKHLTHDLDLLSANGKLSMFLWLTKRFELLIRMAMNILIIWMKLVLAYTIIRGVKYILCLPFHRL